MEKNLIITEAELAMRCACDFCAHLDMTRIVEGKYIADLTEVTFDGEAADIRYELHFDGLKAIGLSYGIAFEEKVEIVGDSRLARKLALGWINRFVRLSRYQIGPIRVTPEESPYFYLTS